MKQQIKDYDMLHHWILPEARCNYRTRYATHPSRNISECISLDCNLFKDWKDGVDYYIFLTSYLPDDNSKKFSLSTPKRLLSAIVRVQEGIPVSKQIIQDIKQMAYKNIPIIIYYEGIITPSLGNS